MTVDDLLNAASQMPDRISYGVAGDGAMTLLTAHRRIENQGRRRQELDVSASTTSWPTAASPSTTLQPGDHVLWTFGPPQ